MAIVTGSPVIGESIAATPITVTGDPVIGQSVAASAAIITGAAVIGQSVAASAAVITGSPVIGQSLAAVVSRFLRIGGTWRSVVTALSGFSSSTPAEKSAAFIGDSLSYGTSGTGVAEIRSALISQGFDADKTYVAGRVGRSIIDGSVPWIPSTQQVINAWRAGTALDNSGGGSTATAGPASNTAGDPTAPFNALTWIISLITNDEWDTDAHWVTKVSTVLNLIASTAHASGRPYRVYWIGGPVYRPDKQADATLGAREARFNAVMDGITVPAGIEFVQYVSPAALTAGIYAGTVGDPNRADLWLTSDATGRHMTTAGYTARKTVTIPPITPPT